MKSKAGSVLKAARKLHLTWDPKSNTKIFRAGNDIGNKLRKLQLGPGPLQL